MMKRNYLLSLIAVFSFLGSFAQEADSLGVIGDDLDLFAVLSTFQESESPEDFEKRLNDPENKINNLDLNEDDEVDYIRVIDNSEDDAHALVLRVDLDEKESQDIAVIELEKSGDNQATIQIVGDEEIYGADYIVEPAQEGEVTERLFMTNLIIVNVWGWPCVRFIYGPTYFRWVSPWRWGLYPKWWKPWRPVRWSVYHTHVHHHHAHFHRTSVRRVARAHAVYHTHRRTSVRVKTHPHYHGHRTAAPTHRNPQQRKAQPVNKSHHTTQRGNKKATGSRRR